MAGRPRTTFDKLQKERSRQEKQAAKRARRQGGTSMEGGPGPAVGPTSIYGAYPDEIVDREADAEVPAEAADEAAEPEATPSG